MWLLLLVACPLPDEGPASSLFEGPTATLRIEHSPFDLQLWVEGDLRARLAPDGLSIAEVPDQGEDFNFDPYNLVAEDMVYARPAGLEWRSIDRAHPVGEAFALFSEDEFIGSLYVDGQRLEFATHPDFPYISVAMEAQDEGYYGLGEYFDAVEQTGQIRPMQFEIAMDLESGYNEAHVPVPFLVGSSGWGWLMDSVRPGVFDVAATDPERLEAIFNSPGHLEMEFYGGETPREVVAAMHQSQGMPELPPVWAFGILQWQNEVTGSEEVRDDAYAMRDLGIPASVIWVDNPWQTSYNSLEPDPEMFPDWDELISELHDIGFRMMAWTTPYVEQSDPGYSEFEPYFVDAPFLFSDFGDLVDLTHPEGRSLWAERVVAAAERGIEGWKLDYGEDVQIGFGTGALHYEFDNGQDERSMHHDFARYYHSAHSTPYGDDDVFLLGRGGVLRGWTVTDCIWPGDLDSGFEVFGVDGYVGGLPAAIRAGSSLAVSGYPFFASDTGGYRHGRPTHEAMVRWTEYAALLPIFQFGGGGADHNPWNFQNYGSSEFNQDTLDAFVRYATLHTRLFPFFYSLALLASTEGTPFLLPQGLAWPEEGVHDDTVFALGEALLVAPVEKEGATSRSLILPEGSWVHWWTGEAYEGEIEVEAPLGEGPLFQRAGSTVPLLHPDIETLAPAGEETVSFDSDPGQLHMRVVPGEGAAEFIVHDNTRLTTLPDGVNIRGGDLYTAGYRVEVWAPGAGSVTVNGDTTLFEVEGPWVRFDMAEEGTAVVD